MTGLKEAADDKMRALDTNIILFHIFKDGKFGKKSSEIIRRIDNGEEVFIPLPVLKETLFELLDYGKSLHETMQIIASFQKDNTKITEDDFATFLQGLQTAEKYNLNPTDGVIAALMAKHGISEIYTNDKDFDRIPGIKRIF